MEIAPVETVLHIIFLLYLIRYAHNAVLWISGRPVAKCNPLLGQAIHHYPQSHWMGGPTLDKWEGD